MNMDKKPEQMGNAELLADIADILDAIDKSLKERAERTDTFPEYPLYRVNIKDALAKIAIVSGRVADIASQMRESTARLLASGSDASTAWLFTNYAKRIEGAAS